MKFFRRLLTLAGIAALAAAIARLRGRGGRPPGNGSWREIDLADPDLLDADPPA